MQTRYGRTQVYQAGISLQRITQQPVNAVSNAAKPSILNQTGGVLSGKPVLGKPFSGQRLTTRSLRQQFFE